MRYCVTSNSSPSRSARTSSIRPTFSPLASITRLPISNSSFTSFFVLMSERQPPDYMVVEPMLPSVCVRCYGIDIDVHVDPNLHDLLPRHAEHWLLAHAEMPGHEGNKALPSRAQPARKDERSRFEIRHARLLAADDVQRDAVD